MEPKVALIGNMNNNLFNLCRYLRDKKIESTLYVLPYDSEHFLPEADSYDQSYTDFVKFLDWGHPYELHRVSGEAIRNEFKQYDFIIGCGTAPAYLAKARIKLDLFAPYGSDLYHYPFYHAIGIKNLIANLKDRRTTSPGEASPRKKSKMGYFPFVYLQRKGIRQAAACAFQTSGKDIYANSLKKLRYANPHYNFSVPMVYNEQYNSQSITQYYPASSYFEEFKKIREGADLLIFSNCRHCWKYEKDPFSLKGNDRLLRGFASFLGSSDVKASLITFEYGSDYIESKRLCEDLGISKRVFWFPLLQRKELMVGMSLSDIVVGNLSDQSWSTYGVVYESMSLSKPIMHNRIDSLYSSETLYSMIQAASDEDVVKKLLFYSKNPSELRRIGREANSWFVKNSVEEPINRISNLIHDKIGT